MLIAGHRLAMMEQSRILSAMPTPVAFAHPHMHMLNPASARSMHQSNRQNFGLRAIAPDMH